METYFEQGVSRGDCLQKIVDKYGIRFTILRERKYRTPRFFGLFVREGVEVEFCLSSKGIDLPGGAAKGPASGSASGTAAAPAALPGDASTLDFNELKKRVLSAAGKDPEKVFKKIDEQNGREAAAQQQILDILRGIKEKIETAAHPKPDQPGLVRAAEMLRHNDFSERFTAGLLERARKELPLEVLENFDAVQERFIEWIGESIKIFPIPDRNESGGGARVLALIGPTGVGKTTTIAKLAAIYGIEHSGRRPLAVRMITIDAFRIGAKKQIMDFGDIMEIPVSYVDNRRDLRREIDLYKEESDLILVDTIGRSPKDSAKLGEMVELLDACGSKAEKHLVLSASTKASDIEHILRQFEPFNYQAVLLTKLDETKHIGNVISALAEKEKPLSFVTDGQSVPRDIKKASVVSFLINLDEFRVDREKFEKRFPEDGDDQFQWG